MSQSVKLVSIATAVPPYVLEQRDVAAAAHRTFALRFADFERLARVFKTSGIRRRYAVRPIEWYLEPLGWPERSGATLIAMALASCLLTPQTKLLMPRASALPRSIRWSPSHRLASPRQASKRGPLRALAFAPMSSASRYSVSAAPARSFAVRVSQYPSNGMPEGGIELR